jgi:hypothetical protein
MSQVRDEVEAWLRGIKGVTCFTEKMKMSSHFRLQA